MKATFLNWPQSQKSWITIVAGLVLAASYAIANKPFNWFVLFVIVINIHMTFNAYRNLIRNDRNKNETMRENDWQIFDEKGLFTFILFFNVLLFLIFFIFAPHSVLEATVLAIYIVLSVLYSLVRSIPILPITCTAISIAILSLSPGAQNSATFSALQIFFYAILFMLVGRGLIRNVKQSKDNVNSIEDVLKIVGGCSAIGLSLLLSSTFFFHHEGLLSILAFSFGFVFIITSCVMFIRLPKMRRTARRSLDCGIVLMLIAILVPNIVSCADDFKYWLNNIVYVFNQSI